MDFILQIWGGSCYLVNKIFFAISEGRGENMKRRLKLLGWILYILGVPAWVIILLGKENWIAASIEAGGVPSMILGLYIMATKAQRYPVTLDRIASFCTYGALFLGGGYSLLDNGGIVSLSQVLEIGVMLGFLLGSYLLAKNSRSGWLFFMLMNGSMAFLMFVQQKPFLAVQQMVSFSFVVYGFLASGKEGMRK